MGKPSKGTPADKRLKANKGSSAGKPGSNGVKGTVRGTGRFGGKKAAPFTRGGSRKR